ncbi:MAG TPA: hypothetical protein VFP72_18185, partial [Kineosporiaceae bacterium]|nr:hypothetical protein [Kineosporiaceae bacterium]
MADLPSWHPSREVLEFAELVLARALPHVPVPLDVPPDLAAAARSAGGLVLEDAEGTPVATLTGDPATGPVTTDRLRPDRPFTHGPLRARRRPPVPSEAAGPAGAGEVEAPGAPLDAVGEPGAAQPVLAVVVTGPLTVRTVEAVAAEAVRGGFRLLWLVVVGAGRRCVLPPEGLLRAVSGAAADADARGAAGEVVVAAVPR